MTSTDPKGNLTKKVYDNVGRLKVVLANAQTTVYTYNDIISLSGEELMRRFKREDSSRHTDGYGLGNSIARSLAEIQHGMFEVTTDGDLFKSMLTFSAAPFSGWFLD